MKLRLLIVLVAVFAGVSCTSAAQRVELPSIANVAAPAPGIVSAGRLGPADIKSVRAAGIRHVFDLTTEAESPDFDEAARVRDAGMKYSRLPVRGAEDLTLENVLAFDAVLRDAERPLLVHCGSGNRVGAMAALRAAWLEGRSEEEAVAIGKAWGLTSLEAEVRSRIE